MKRRSAFVRFASLGALALFTSAALTASTAAHADVIRLDADSAALGIDPAADFDAECLGPAPLEDCDARAALIEAELVSILAQLENDSDPKTLPIFQEAIDLDSPLVQTMAMRYLARADQQPTDFLSKVRTFFLGPDAPLGVSAAEVLRDSADETDQAISELYRQERRAADYAPTSTPTTDPDATNDDLVLACTKDARLNAMAAFAPEEQFAPAERLLMYDRFLTSFVAAGNDYPVTSFVTDASLESVSAFFTKRFGKSYGPYGDAQTHYQELTLELVGLQAAAQKGDQAAIARIQQIGEELQSLQGLISLGSYLQLPSIHAENDLIWIEGNPDDLLSNPTRAVTAGTDASLGKTVIRYINAPKGTSSGGVGGAGGTSGAGGKSAGGRSGGGAAGNSGAAGSTGSKDDSGCGCSLPGAPSTQSGLLALAGAALVAMGSRRRRRS